MQGYSAHQVLSTRDIFSRLYSNGLFFGGPAIVEDPSCTIAGLVRGERVVPLAYFPPAKLLFLILRVAHSFASNEAQTISLSVYKLKLCDVLRALSTETLISVSLWRCKNASFTMWFFMSVSLKYLSSFCVAWDVLKLPVLHRTFPVFKNRFHTLEITFWETPNAFNADDCIYPESNGRVALHSTESGKSYCKDILFIVSKHSKRISCFKSPPIKILLHFAFSSLSTMRRFLRHRHYLHMSKIVNVNNFSFSFMLVTSIVD